MREVKLRDCGRWLSGGTPDTAVDAYWNGDIPWITSSSLKGRFISDSRRRLTTMGVRAGSRLVPSGTILFVVRGMSLKNEFRVGLTRRAVAFGQDCKALLPADGIDPRFLLLALEAAEDRVLRLVDEASHGTGRLQTSLLGSLALWIPPLEEQRRIAEIVDTIDETIQTTERLIAKLRLTEKGTATHVLRSVDTAERSPLAEIADVAGGLALSSAKAVRHPVELPYLRVANVQDGYIDTEELKTVRVSKTEVGRYALKRGDVLMNEGGDFDKLGRGAVWDGHIDPCLHQNHVFRIRCFPEVLLPEFLAVFTASAEGKSFFVNNSKQTTNLSSISKSVLSKMPTMVPLLSDQRRVIAFVQAATQRIETEQATLDKLRATRAGLAADLLSGRVRTVPT